MELLGVRTFIQNFLDKKKEALIGLAAVIGGAAVLIGYFQSGPNASSYAQASAAFAKWEAAPQDEALYSGMREAVRQAPALGKRYEGVIAQNLLNTERLDEALELANRAINRVESEAPLHSQYARTSLLIEQGNYQEALERSVGLKEQLLQEDAGSLLYAHNLLRIAFLQQELKNRPGEKAAWEELENFLGASAHADLVMANFSDKNIDLTKYISERKKNL
jgi:hypothetical protein